MTPGPLRWELVQGASRKGANAGWFNLHLILQLPGAPLPHAPSTVAKNAQETRAPFVFAMYAK